MENKHSRCIPVNYRAISNQTIYNCDPISVRGKKKTITIGNCEFQLIFRGNMLIWRGCFLDVAMGAQCRMSLEECTDVVMSCGARRDANRMTESINEFVEGSSSSSSSSSAHKE